MKINPGSNGLIMENILDQLFVDIMIRWVIII